ncbi:CDP-alcohol phosphatidyltransferase family protein [Alphaproteobacteria bacterium]|jgi:phosphatidylglycerophosphate synthase|nr:CDP-alcohol phosphatidyltransferase family protein [Alphaproteobacteria bacterium]
MFDAQLRPLIDRLLNPIGRGLVALGMTANQVTMIGAAFGLIAAGCVAAGLFYPALWFVIANRVIDGLDGAVARASRSSDFGGYLDIVSDFIFYSAIPMAFAVARPETALAAAFLIFSFIGTATSFLGFAILAEKHQVTTQIRGKKAFYYLGGLTEGTETILLFLAMLVWPDYFSLMAIVFGILCWVTTGTRIYAAYRQFND